MTINRNYTLRIDNGVGKLTPDEADAQTTGNVPVDLFKDIAETLATIFPNTSEENIAETNGSVHISYTIWGNSDNAVNVSENIH